MLDKIEQLAPQWFLALLAIAVTIGVLIYRNPPHSLCQTQKRAYVQAQSNFLGGGNYDRFFERCLKSNSRGACEPYFSGFKEALDDFQVLDSECTGVVAGHPRVRSAFSSFLIQVTLLAWGSEGPESIHVRQSWLGPGHMRVFCRVQSQFRLYYGEQGYKTLKNQVLPKLPNVRKLTNRQITDRSLFSTPCNTYF